MNVFLIILKIIGILLLIILAFILILLFHPVFYKVRGECKEKIFVQGYIWWLFHILGLSFSIKDSTVSFRLKLLGKTLFSSDVEENLKEVTKPKGSDEKVSDEKGSDEKKVLPEKEKAAAKQDAPQNKKKKGSFQEKIARISDFKHMIAQLKAEYKNEENRLAIPHIWQELLYIIKHLKPKYIQADMTFSAGDPAITGQIIGICSLIPFMYKKDVHIYPDFTAEKFYIRGNFICKGHMQLWHVCLVILRIIRDKNIRRLIHKVRKQEVTHE